MPFKSLNRKARGSDNLGGVVQMVVLNASDFLARWPLKTDIVAGAIAGPTIPLKAGVNGVVLTFDNGSGRFKSAKKGSIGYQNMDHEGEAVFAGYDAVQSDSLNSSLNEGAVIIATDKDGVRFVLGASYEPLVIEDSMDTGAKSDDKRHISMKFKTEQGLPFHPPALAAAVVVPIATT